MKFSEMNQKQLREARNELQGRMRNTLRPSVVKNLTDEGVVMVGGTLPAVYNHETGNLSIWGRGSRYSGGKMTVKELQEAESEVKNFFNEYLGGH